MQNETFGARSLIAVIMAILKCLQVNIGEKDEGKGINGQEILTTKVISENFDVIAIQEPNNFKITGRIIFKSKLIKKRVRASIWLSNEVMRTRNPTFLEHFSNEDLSAVKIDIGRNTHVILCSIYPLFPL
jgi:hypothetical protein